MHSKSVSKISIVKHNWQFIFLLFCIYVRFKNLFFLKNLNFFKNLNFTLKKDILYASKGKLDDWICCSKRIDSKKKKIMVNNIKNNVIISVGLNRILNRCLEDFKFKSIFNVIIL